MIVHTQEEIIKQEWLTGLRLAGYIQLDTFMLIPVLLRTDRSEQDRKDRIMILNERSVKRNGKV